MKEKLELHKKWLNNEEDGVRLDLSYADLSSANLSYADLSSANLSYANLRGANLRGAIGNNKEMKTLQLGTYIVTIYKEIIQIGCQNHSISEWENFDDNYIKRMDTDALEWWRENKDIVLTLAKRGDK